MLVQRIHPRADDFEIFEFFSQAGKARDIRLIRDQRSGKSKSGLCRDVRPGVRDEGACSQWHRFQGATSLGASIDGGEEPVAQAAKNVAAASAMMGGAAPATEPIKLVVSELHPHISKDDIRDVFSPFGQVSEIQFPTIRATDRGLGSPTSHL